MPIWIFASSISRDLGYAINGFLGQQGSHISDDSADKSEFQTRRDLIDPMLVTAG